MKRYLTLIIVFLTGFAAHGQHITREQQAELRQYLVLKQDEFAGTTTPEGDRIREAFIIDVVDFIENEDYYSARAKLEIVLNSNPKCAEAYFYLATCDIFEKANLSVAIDDLKMAVQLDPGNYWYRSRLAKLYEFCGDLEKTETLYAQMIEEFPNKHELYFALTRLYWTQKRYTEALQIIDKSETIFGKNEPMAVVKFEILSEQGKNLAAYEYLEAFNKEYSSPRVLSMLGDYQMSMFNDTTAVALYNEALDLEPDYPEALGGLADVYMMTRNYPKFFEYANKIALSEEIDPRDKCSYLKGVMQRLGENSMLRFQPQLDTLFTNALELTPNDYPLCSLVGSYYFSTSREDLGLPLFRRNYENHPQDRDIAVEYLKALLYMEKLEEVSTISWELFRQFDSDLDFLDIAIYADYNLGRVDQVISGYEIIVDESDDDKSRLVAAYSGLGDMYHKKGETKKAYRLYERALKINPDYAPLLNNYAYFLALEGGGGNLSKAYKMSRKTIVQEPDNPTYLDTFGWILFLQGKAVEAKPIFKHAMLYGGRDSVVMLDHYAEVLFALGEYDLAFTYWSQALAKNVGENKIPNLEEKVKAKREEAKTKKAKK